MDMTSQRVQYRSDGIFSHVSRDDTSDHGQLRHDRQPVGYTAGVLLVEQRRRLHDVHTAGLAAALTALVGI
jgi:hypothetical protein